MSKTQAAVFVLITMILAVMLMGCEPTLYDKVVNEGTLTAVCHGHKIFRYNNTDYVMYERPILVAPETYCQKLVDFPTINFRNKTNQ